ncbi:MAG: alpha/beta hydrolase [Geobacter sp.]|nr:alpha/beta hydrolase [Geobacter sp.]
MENTLPLPMQPRTIRNHPTLLNVATAATGFIRQIAIKPFTPRSRRREFLLKDSIPRFHAVRNALFKEKGSGDIPTIVIGGFVPDATEAVEFQRPLFKSYGSIYYINYSKTGFSTEMFFAQLADLIEDINRRGKKPVIFSVSFGCGLVNAFLRSDENDPFLRIRGVVMASPVLCTEDLVRTEREKGSGVRMLESNLKRILQADATNNEELDRQINRARRCFQSLFEAGAENRPLNRRHLSIRKRVMGVIEKTSSVGGYERVLALKGFTAPAGNAAIFTGPALTLLAEAEDNLLVPGSPTLNSLRKPEDRVRMFPRGVFRDVVARANGDAVPHASLIFHHHCYNPLIEAWYDKLLTPRLFAVA